MPIITSHRLSRHGFTDVMKDTTSLESFVQTGGGADSSFSRSLAPVDLDLEATDPLAKHEITFQFAAFRLPPGEGYGALDHTGYDGHGRGTGGLGGTTGSTLVPTSLYFTYQFYTCLPTRTERMLLRPDAPRDRLYKARR